MSTSEQARRVFQYDIDRAISIRFAPSQKRHTLLLLSVFDQELAKIRHQTPDPILRRIKIQFWREALADEHAKGHALARELRECFSTTPGLLEYLDDLLDAHESIMEEVTSFRAIWNHYNQRQSALFMIAYQVLNASKKVPDIAFFEKCGVAYGGITQLCQRGKDQLEPEDLNGMIEEIESDHSALCEKLSRLDPAARSAVLPLALVTPYLKLFLSSEKSFSKPIDLHPAKKVWTLWRAARKGF